MNEFDNYKQGLLDYLAEAREYEKQEIEDHENLPEAEKIDQGFMIKNAIVKTANGQGDGELTTAVNYTKWKIGDSVKWERVIGDMIFTGTAYVSDNFIDSICLTGIPHDTSVGETFNLYGCENELYGIYISIIQGIQEGLPGAGFLKVLGGIKEPQLINKYGCLDDSGLTIPNHLNADQRKCVEDIIKCPQIYAIQGPPGTGKTDLLSVIAKLYSEQGREVLIVSNTHQAVNNALNKAAQYDLPIYKIGNELKSQGLDSRIKVLRDNRAYKYERRDTQRRRRTQGDVVGMSLCGALLNLGIHGSAFSPSIVLVDEASQITLAQAAGIGAIGAGCCVFIGDDRQMPPIFHENMKSNPLSVSIFEYLQKLLPSELKTVLTTTYRMNTPICRLVSQSFYEPYGITLQSHESIADRHIDSEDIQEAVEYVTVKTSKCEDSNLEEAKIAVSKAEYYRSLGENVAIITPFRKQVNLIREQWRNAGNQSSDILVDTVERLQGQDVDVIILSTSVSDVEYYKSTLPFLLNPNRLNVMISRAKKKVVIIKSPIISLKGQFDLQISDIVDLPNQEPESEFFIEGEPSAVTEARRLILKEFSDLEFYEDGHKYFLHGKELPSVSGIGHRFIKEPFDEQKQAVEYAKKNGGTADYWIQQWNCKSFKATTLGTKTHEFGESLAYLKAGHPELICDSVRFQYYESCRYLAPIHPKEEAIESFLNELPPSYHLVLNETKVYSGKNPDSTKNLKEQICGTFDMLYWYDGDGDVSRSGFVILDYKTNSDLYKEYNRSHQKMLLPPFSDLYEEDYSLYVIQLNLYALMLEDIGLPILARKIVWLRDDKTYQIIDMPDVSAKLRAVL